VNTRFLLFGMYDDSYGNARGFGVLIRFEWTIVMKEKRIWIKISINSKIN